LSRSLRVLSLPKFKGRGLSSAKIDRRCTYIAAFPQWTLKSGKKFHRDIEPIAMARVSACQKYPNKLTLGAFRASRLHGRNGTTNFSIGWNATRNHWSTLRIATT